MSKAKTERYDVTVQGGGHGMTTDPLDGLEQLRRIIDEQPEPAPESVMLGLDYCYAEWVAERARHAEEVANRVAEMRGWGESKLTGAQHEIEHLRDQLRKVEGERDAERKHATEMEERALDLVRDLRLAQVELHALRSLLPDVRACAEYVIGEFPENHPAAFAGRRILAALDSHECPECHMPGHHKLSCSRGGSKGGRFWVRLDSRKDGE